MTAQTEDRKRRRKAIIAWGALAGIAALITTAAFTDQAFLNLGSNGIGGSDSTYSIQVGATDADGVFVDGWQEADDPAGVPIRLDGAEAVFPGSDPVRVVIPVRNASPHFDSSLAVSLARLTDTAENVTDPDYLTSLRFSVAQPATTLSTTPVATSDLTFDEVQALALNNLANGEESTVTLEVRLLSQSESGAAWDDNSLAGKGAYLQAVLDGSSINRA